MRDNELRKLKRQDLLELLIMQSRNVVNLHTEIEEKDKTTAEHLETLDRLKEKLNDKDELINKLKGRLDQKDARIVELESRITMAGADNIGDDADLMMNKIYEISQNAVKQYLKNSNDHEADQPSDAGEQSTAAGEQPINDKKQDVCAENQTN